MEVKQARRLKDLERENGELKKMLAGALLKNRVLEEVVEAGMCSGRAVCRILSLSRATYWYRGKPPSPRKRALHKNLPTLAAGPQFRAGASGQLWCRGVNKTAYNLDLEQPHQFRSRDEQFSSQRTASAKFSSLNKPIDTEIIDAKKTSTSQLF